MRAKMHALNMIFLPKFGSTSPFLCLYERSARGPQFHSQDCVNYVNFVRNPDSAGAICGGKLGRVLDGGGSAA